MPQTTQKPLSWFKAKPQIRADLGSESDLKNLGESLSERQLSPLVAMADGELVFGFRRLAAASIVGMQELTVTIYSEPLTLAEIKKIQLTENMLRLDMSAWEKWKACEELRSLNPDWTAKDLADHLKLDPSAVTKWLAPSKCIAAWQEALRDGSVGIGDCYAASLASSEQQQRDMLAMKLAGATRDSLSRMVQRSKVAAHGNQIRSSRITIPMSSGTKIVVSGNDLSMSDVVDCVGEFLSAARKGLKDQLDVRTWQSVMCDKAAAMKGYAADV